jgi:hypothetical protein
MRACTGLGGARLCMCKYAYRLAAVERMSAMLCVVQLVPVVFVSVAALHGIDASWIARV